MSDNFIDKLNLSWRRRLPVILQTEITECGHACLAMVLRYWGYHTDISSLRQRFPVDPQGTSLARIIQIADQVNLTGRALRLEIEGLAQLKLPCILHWELNHFVVLESVSSKRIIIHDPARGRRILTPEEVSKLFTGVALELSPSPDFEKRKEVQRLRIRDVISSIKGLWPNIIQIMVLSLIIQIASLLGPYQTQLVIDKVLPASDENLLTILGIAFLVLAIFHITIDTVRAWVVLYLSTTLNFNLVSRLFRHLIKLPIDYFERRHIGDIQSRFGSLGAIEDLLTSQFISSILDGIMLIITLVVMFYYSPLLTFITLGATVIYIIIQLALYQPIKAATEEQIVLGAKEETHFLETLRAVQPIKVFGREAQRFSEWTSRYADAVNAGIHLAKINISYGAVRGMLTATEAVIIVWVGGLELINNAFSVGMFMAFMAYRQRFSDQAQALLDNFFQFLMLRLHMERLADIALSPIEQDVDIDLRSDLELRGSVRLESISFKYSEESENILDNISLSIEVGESVAITGASGCGKSTLLKVMMGLLRPQSGKVLIDEIPLEQIGLKHYREISSAIMQNDSLLSGSIIDNVCFFESDINLRKVEKALRDAEVWGDIEKMPMGLHTFIGDMGNILSGGQQQRILLARALYREPKILFMDEATSHLDVETERDINDTISKLPITRIIVAHRQETIALADRVIPFSKLVTET